MKTERKFTYTLDEKERIHYVRFGISWLVGGWSGLELGFFDDGWDDYFDNQEIDELDDYDFG